jgi:two-component system, OmpR family, alkaline phosphatase synthesis response regulator PhoP
MKKQILVVATESEVVQSILNTLRLAGHSVLMADRGLDAIKRARDSSPDLILIDAILPDMDGLTLADILRRLPSTSDLRTMLLKSRQPPPNETERLPINSDDLLAQVSQALDLCRESAVPDSESEWSGMRVM